MSSKTPERDLKDRETLDMVQNVLSGALKNMDVPVKAWDGVRRLGGALGSFPESLMNIKLLGPYKDSFF